MILLSFFKMNQAFDDGSSGGSLNSTNGGGG